MLYLTIIGGAFVAWLILVVLFTPGIPYHIEAEVDPRSDHFQSSTAEALYLSNNPEIQKLFLPANKNLAARLGTMKDGGQVVDAAFWTILSRPPDNEEKAYLAHWLDDRRKTWPRACGELAWALVTSAEFRFNH